MSSNRCQDVSIKIADYNTEVVVCKTIQNNREQ